jgi:hypothetical protein
MKINFTKAEYAVLLKSIYMAEWLMTAVDVGENPALEKYTAIFQKIYSHGKEMGCEHLVEHFAAEGRFYPSNGIEEDATVRGRIDHYNNEIFWEELVSRLAERDLAKKGLGLDGSGPMSDEQMAALTDLEHYYSEEFENNELARLILSESNY